MEIVKNHLEIAAGIHVKGNAKGHGVVYHSVDIDAVCQKVLLSHDPVHVFKDLLSFLKPDVRLAISRVMADYEGQLKTIQAEVQQAGSGSKAKQAAKGKLKTMGEQMLASLMESMDKFSDTDFFMKAASCAKHPHTTKPCALFAERSDGSDAADKEYFMAGTSCTDWSSMGGGSSLAGATVVPFSVELQVVKRRRPRVYFHECTRNFKPSILAKCLEDAGTLVHGIVV